MYVNGAIYAERAIAPIPVGTRWADFGAQRSNISNATQGVICSTPSRGSEIERGGAGADAAAASVASPSGITAGVMALAHPAERSFHSR